MIRIGIIGCGYWGSRVFNGYTHACQDNLHVKLVALCDTDELRLARFKDSRSIQTTTNLDELLLHVDAVHICTPSETHYEVCKTALLNEKHVLVEKPMAMKSKHAEELVNLAKNKRLILSVGHIFRFNNALFELKRLIKAGKLGKIEHLSFRWNALAWLPDRDILWDLLPHPIDITDYLVDHAEYPLSTEHKKTKDYLFVLLNFKDFTVQVEATWSLLPKIREVTVVGSERVADCDCLNQQINLYHDGMKETVSVTPNDTILDECSHFVESIKNIGSTVRNSAEIGLKITKIVEMVDKGEVAS